LFSSNVYKIVNAGKTNEFAFGCGDGLFFATYDGKWQLAEDSILAGKYITQICSLGQ